MKIIKFEEKYRDDLIFMILEAKNALGRIPGLNQDLLDIKAHYFDNGDMFWIAIDDNNRVIGSVGYRTNEDMTSVTLHRLFVKCSFKHQGIGTNLLKTAESYIESIGKKRFISILVLVMSGLNQEHFIRSTDILNMSQTK